MVLVLLLLLSASLPAADDLIKRYRGKTVEDVLAQREVAALPFSARIELLVAVAPQIKDMPPGETMRLIKQSEELHAASGLKSLEPRVWSQGCQWCGHFFHGGRQLLTAEYGPLKLAVSAAEFEKYVSVLVVASMSPDAKFSVDILPGAIGFVQTSPLFVPFESVSIRDVAKTVQHGAGWKAGMVAGFGGMATKQIKVEEQGQLDGTYSGSGGSGTFRGTYNGDSKVTVPDEEARKRARDQADAMLEEAQTRSGNVVKSALLATTLGPGQHIAGFTYFKNRKGLRAGILRVAVGNVGFEFPLLWQR